MRTTDEASTVTSAVLDLRQVRLTEMLTKGTLDKALQRVIPDVLTAPVPVAAFSSAI
jgi:FXSXX-COOH protein